jgi:hypothetical protein
VAYAGPLQLVGAAQRGLVRRVDALADGAKVS